MDTKKHTGPEYLEAFAKMLEMKAGIIDYDLIISCDNYAFEFIKRSTGTGSMERSLLYSAESTSSSPPRLEGLSNVTGFSEENDFAGSLELIRRTFPERKKLVCILDETLTGQATRSGLEEVLPDYKEEFESIEIWSHLSMEELLRDLSLLDERFVVYYIYFQRDRLERYYEFHHSSKMIGESSGAPVFASWDFQFTDGVIGGKLLQGREQGRLAGEAVLKILEGASIDSFPPLPQVTPPCDLRLQGNKALRSVFKKDLPERSTVINSPDSLFLPLPPADIPCAGSFYILLLIMVMILLSVVRKLKISEKKINELNSSLNNKVARRTEELKFTNNSLVDTLDKLQNHTERTDT